MNSLQDVKQRITYRSKDRLEVFRTLSLGEQSSVLLEVSAHIQKSILNQLTHREVVEILDHVDLRSAEKLVLHVSDVRKRARIVRSLKQDVREKVEHFLRFHPKATFDLLSVNYVWLSGETTIDEAADAIDEHYQETGRFPEVLVHERGELVGEVPLSALVREQNSTQLVSCMRPTNTVVYTESIQTIIQTLNASGRRKVVVLDTDGSVLGTIYADDALTLFGKLPTESLYDFAGLDQTEQPFDSAWEKFSHRNKWLVVNLVTAFFAGSVILIFRDTVDQLAILAVYIPIVAGMGGNAASQTFAVIMRGITLGTINLKNGLPAVWNETKAGFYNGLLIGAIVAAVSLFVNGSALLGLVVGMAMISVHIVAGFFGAITPLILKRLHKDPASTSMIFVSTATDVLGMIALLGLGALILI